MRTQTDGRKSKTLWAVLAAVVLLGGGGVWGITSASRHSKAEPTVQVPKELSVDALKNTSADEARKAIRSAMERKDLTDEQRAQIGHNLREVWEQRMDARLNEYFAASEPDRKKILDKQIDEMEQMRRDREARDNENSANRDQERERMRRLFGDRNRQRTREERKTASETRKADDRARRMAYFTAMRARMTERGITPPQWGGPGGPRGGRRS